MNMQQDPIQKLSRDVRKAAVNLSDSEARYLVDYYYMAQEDRKRANNQVRALEEAEEPNQVVLWLAEQATAIEKEIKKVLDVYTDGHLMGSWMRETVGIGPVISAGFLAHINIAKAPTVGHIWRFAGLDPTLEWKRGQKRPFNAKLKTLCWKAGQSFMKFSGREDCFYGHVYRERKEYEVARNERGDNKELAAKLIAKYSKTTEAFKHLSDGRLPPAQIDARARRYAVKLFLSHLHGEWYERHHGEPAPKPYPIAHLNHAHQSQIT